MKFGMPRVAVLAALALAGCVQNPPAPPPTAQTQDPDYQTFRSRIAEADSIVVARLIDATPEVGPDRFVLTTSWQPREWLKGARPAMPQVRFPSDVRSWRDGPLDAEAVPMFKGQDYLLFLSSTVYAGQAKARGGAPLPAATSAGIGYFLLRDGQVQPTTDYDGPRDIATVRQLIGQVK